MTKRKAKKKTTKKKKAGRSARKPASPKPPAGLPKSAAAAWRRFIRELVKLDRTNLQDLIGFEVFCREFARWQRLEAQVGEKDIVTTAGVIKAHPALREAARARDAWMAQGQRLGLVPSKPAPTPVQPKKPPSGPQQPEGEATEPEPDGWSEYADEQSDLDSGVGSGGSGSV